MEGEEEEEEEVGEQKEKKKKKRKRSELVQAARCPHQCSNKTFSCVKLFTCSQYHLAATAEVLVSLEFIRCL